MLLLRFSPNCRNKKHCLVAFTIIAFQQNIEGIDFHQSGPAFSSALVSRFLGKGCNVDGECELLFVATSAEMHLELVDGAVLLSGELTALKGAPKWN